MITLPGYTIIAEIHAGKNTVIYRARRERDQTPVILKMPRLEQPTPKDVAQLRHEYEITKNLDMDGVVKMHGLETHQQRPILVLEDFGGQSLKNLIAAHPFDPATFLVIAIQLADTLGAVHQRQIIHKDIKPTNIIVDFGLEQIPGESKSKISKMPAKSPQGERVQNPLAYPPGQAKSKIQVKITDFGIASRLSRENPTISNPTMLEGTLAYISPEQTGRMNRAVDYRTDFYSLGVTFYEMLTGRLPFEADDPMALVHAHIAKQPLPPVALRQDVPPMVSNIIMKLLAKTAEERYQSASGLKADLERCLHQWQATGQIESFRLGRQDMSDRFELPQKLYGREQDIGTLLAVFGRVAREEQPGNGATRHLKSPTAKGYAVANLKSEIVLVAGSAGIGKSSLINEVHKAIAGVEQRGYFISGKFDQYKRNIPYASLIQAFQDLARQILTESDSQIAAWQEKLLAALGPNGQVIIDVIPEVELIIGPQPEVPSLPPAETQNRFNLVFQNFVNVFAGADQPLAIFLDDLQWADAASLKLIHLLVTNPASHRLFMIGAYRDNEVSSAHPLSLALNDLKEAGATINQITLKPLELVHINQLITHTLHCPADKAKPLAELVLSKTAGNPFFVNQFLRSLYDENLLTFIPPGGGSPPSFPPGGGDEGGGGWQWDIAQIQAQGITDNVVELMAGKIEKLAPATQHILKLAACIGNEFDLQTLTIVHEKPPAATAADLWPALQEGLILGISDLRFTVYDLEQESSIPNPQSPISNPQSPIPNPQFKFLHDRVQQAAYSLIADDQKQEVHLKIGQLLLKSTAAADLDDKIFDIVNQLNEGADLIENQAGRIELARLNLIAGKKAKAATAYESALRYLSTGVELLTPPIAHSQTPNDREAGQMTNDQPKIVNRKSKIVNGNAWQSHYDLTLALYTERAECEYLTGHFDEAGQSFGLVLANAQTNLDKAQVYHLKVIMYTNLGRLHEAIEAGLMGLKLLGLDLPAAPHQNQADQAVAQVTQQIGGRPITDLNRLPEMTEPTQLAAVKLLKDLIVPTWYTTQRNLFYVVTATLVNMTLKHGLSEAATGGYVWYGTIVGSDLGDYKAGYEFGELAFKLNEARGDTRAIPMVNTLLGVLLQPWRSHLKIGVEYLKQSYQVALEVGDWLWASITSYAIIYSMHIKGDKLEEIYQASQPYLDFSRRTQQAVPTNMLILSQRFILSLQGLTRRPGDFSDEGYDEAAHLQELQEKKVPRPIFWYHIIKAQALYLCGRHAEALTVALKSDELIEQGGGAGTITIGEHYFFFSLILTALYSTAPAEEQARYDRLLARNQLKLKTWADNCPENFLHKQLLVAAEMARLQGNDMEAMNLYEEALNSARENEYTQNEALAHELAAQFYLAQGLGTPAQAYLLAARAGYERWGATAKVRLLEEKYPQFLTPIGVDGRPALPDFEIESPAPTPTTTTSSTGEAAFDLATVMKASQAIAGEIVLDRLLEKLMKIVIENAGAQRGFLILEDEGQLMIEAEAKAEAEIEVIALQSLSVAEANNLSQAIVNYVARTKEAVVLDDATREGRFTTDPYVIANQPKSILCTPLINQGQLLGLLYLENNLTAAAFTPDRLEVLQLLSAQAAVSIENARLYTGMAENERKYRTLFEDSRDAIFISSPAGHLIDINQALLDLFGYTRAEILRLDVRTFYVDPADRLRFQQAIEGAGSVRDFEVRFKKKDGSVVDCLMTATIRRAEDGQIVAYQGIVRDITEQKRAQKLLEDYSQTLEQEVSERTRELSQTLDNLKATQSQLVEAEKMAALGGLVAGVAHEINTPVGVGVTAASLLEDKTRLFYNTYQSGQMKRADLEKYLDTAGQSSQMILRNLQRAAELIQSFKQVAVDQSSETRREFVVKQYLDEILLSLRPHLKKTQHTIAINGDDSLTLDSYPGAFAQIVTNLVMNSLIHAYEPEQGGQLTFAFKHHDNRFIFEYNDDGKGIPPENLAKIFDPFFTTKRGQGGSGLGLHIIYNLVTQKLGGTIRCESEVGRGTGFVIEMATA